jgi:hypothetical protein
MHQLTRTWRRPPCRSAAWRRCSRRTRGPSPCSSAPSARSGAWRSCACRADTRACAARARGACATAPSATRASCGGRSSTGSATESEAAPSPHSTHPHSSEGPGLDHTQAERSRLASALYAAATTLEARRPWQHRRSDRVAIQVSLRTALSHLAACCARPSTAERESGERNAEFRGSFATGKYRKIKIDLAGVKRFYSCRRLILTLTISPSQT